MKIITVLGARPQFIKAATVSRVFAQRGGCKEFLLHTGQHFDSNMSDVFFNELEIPAPAFNLGIGGGGHGQNTGRMLEGIETILLQELPDAVMVYGDTDSTLAGALAAAKLHIPLVHVESGLRSYNRAMPEELNRVLTDHASDLLLTPTELAVSNLQKEGIGGAHVINVGDVMFDAALHFFESSKAISNILERLKVNSKEYILATVHRQENTDNPIRLKRIFEAFERSEKIVVLPLHPRTRQRIASQGIHIPDNCVVTEPLGYLDMVMLEKNALLIATDSGGVQKEAYFHQVPCVTLRDETEWVELVELGWNHLASPLDDSFVDVLTRTYPPGRVDSSPYGSGAAGESVVSAVLSLR